MAIADKAVTVVQFACGFDPLFGIDCRKSHVAVRELVDFGDFQTREPIPGRSIDFTSSSDKDHLRIKQHGLIDRLVHRRKCPYAVATPHPIPGDHKGRPARQRTTDGVIGPPAHDQYVSHGQGLEALPVRRNTPRYVVFGANHAIRRDGGYPDDLGHDQTAIGALMPGCGSYPSMAMSSKVKSSMEEMSGLRTSLGSGRGARLS